MTRFGVIVLIVMAVAMGGFEQAHAQTAATKVENEAKKIEEPAGPTIIAPYDKKLMRLSEVLGSIHFLRELCHADEGQKWRSKMVALIDAEEPRPARRSRMIARFNRGYGAYNRTYRTCTPAALLAVNRYMKEGVRLTGQITTRYGR